MKVVKKEAPKEEVKFEDIFVPEDYEFICDDCLAEKVESLEEDVVWLAEDILDHDDTLEMLWEKIQAVEDDQLQDVENLSNVVDILGCLQEAHKLVLDIIIKQNETIKKLDGEIKEVDNGWIVLFWFLVVWNFILTCVLCYHVF